MGCIYKRPEDVRNLGDRAPYTIKWKAIDGSWKRRRTSPHRDVAIYQLQKVEQKIALQAVGLVDEFEEHRETPIGDLVAAFLVILGSGALGGRRGRGAPTRRYMVQVEGRLRRALAAMTVSTMADLSSEKAEVYLATLMENGRAAKTRDDIAWLLRQFGGWLKKSKRTRVNPFADLVLIAGEADIRRVRRALTVEEFERLLDAARRRPVERYLRGNGKRGVHPSPSPAKIAELQRIGRARALLYTAAVHCGLRRNELKQLVWGDVFLDEEIPCLNVRAEVAKSRKSADVPLSPFLAAALREERHRQQAEQQRIVKDTESVFLVGKDSAADFVKDALFAGLRIKDEKGRIIDFHALRATCATWLARTGVAPQLAQRILRHSDIRMTLRHYTRLDLRDTAHAVAKLPVPGGEHEGAALREEPELEAFDGPTNINVTVLGYVW